MKISVAIASYNGAKYILEQLESIKNQTLHVSEVVICDDCSTDGTDTTVKDYINNNKLDGWVFFTNEKNLGYAENFRGCLNRTTGDIIFLCDQDDVWELDRVEKMVAVMNDNENIGVLCTSYSTFTDENPEKLNGYYSSEIEKVEKIKLNNYTRFLRSLGSAMCISRSFYNMAKEHWFTNWAQDEFLWCVGVLLEKCYFYHYCSVRRRIHQGQFSGGIGKGKQRRIKYLEGEVLCAEALIKIAEDIGASKKAKKLYYKNLKASKLRLGLVKHKKILNAVVLPFYLRYYYSKKSYLAEIKIALKGN